MANSICKRCKFYDRCDEDNLMRSYVTSPDENGCSHYVFLAGQDDVADRQQAMWAKRASEEKKRQQERFNERIGSIIEEVDEAFTYIDEYLDKMADEQGIPRVPTNDISPMMFSVGYMTWKQIQSQIEPFDSDAVVRYNDYIARNEGLTHNYKKKDPRGPYKLCMQKIDEILKAYRDFGLTGPGTQNEEIHNQAVEWQQFVDQKKAEEYKKVSEERKKKAEAVRRQKAKEEEEKRVEQEAKEKRLKGQRIHRLVFWGVWLLAAIITFCLIEEWWEWVLSILAFIVAAVIRFFVHISFDD